MARLVRRLCGARHVALLVLALGWATVGHAAWPPVNQLAQLQAEVSYLLAGSSVRETVYSNYTVLEFMAADEWEVQGDRRVLRSPGQALLLPYRLVNLGSTQLALKLQAVNGGLCSGDVDSQDVADLRVVVDVNANGVAEPAELSGPPELVLRPGSQASLLVLGRLPLAPGSGACIQVLAESAGSKLTRSFSTFVNIADSPSLRLLKQSQYERALQVGSSDSALFTLTAMNTGLRDALMTSAAPGGQAITIDGSPSRQVLVRDEIPTGASFLQGSLQASHASAIKLYRVASDPAYAYRSQDPGTAAVEVAVAFPFDLPAGHSLGMSFRVRASSYAVPSLDNVAQLLFCSVSCSSGVQAAQSNLASVPLAAQRLGVAHFVLRSRYNATTTQPNDGTVTYTLGVTARNYGELALFNLQLSHLLSGSQRFGTPVGAGVPAPGQYGVVPGSLRVVDTRNSGTVIPLNVGFTGEGSQTGLLLAGVNASVLPAGAQFTLTYDVRVNVSGRANETVFSQVSGQGSITPQAALADATDLSTSGTDPDPDGDLNPNNNSTPTPVVLLDGDSQGRLLKGLQISKSLATPVRVADGVFDLKYTLRVANKSDVPIPHVRVLDNLACAFNEKSNIQNWRLLAPPVARYGVLRVSSSFTGRADCTLEDLNPQKPTAFPLDPALILNDASMGLAPGAEEEISLSVRVNKKTSGVPAYVTNVGWLVALQTNTLHDPEVLGVATASVQGVFVDPQGFVYDSASRQPVAGAVVTLRRLSCESGAVGAIRPEEVLGSERYTFNPADGSVSMTTGVDGLYEFSWRAPPVAQICTYGLDVQPPLNYVQSALIPPQSGVYRGCGMVVPDSTIPTGGQPTTWFNQLRSGYDPAASPPDCPVLNNHIPLDPVNASLNLLLSKQASKTQAELGDFVEYQLKLANRSGVNLSQVVLEDVLPPGFVYVPGSSWRAEARTADPVRLTDAATGRVRLRYELGAVELKDKGEIVLRYRLRIGIGAPNEADAVNTAVASAAASASHSVIKSNTAQAKVRVSGGVLSHKGLAIGRVWADCNGNGVQDGDSEPGLPGVRLYLEDGTSVITDAFGRWSLYGLKSVTHVLRVDTSTLPAQARLVPLDNRQAGQAHSRFLDLKHGEMVRADVAVQGCDGPGLKDEIQQRRLALAKQGDAHMQALVASRLPTEAQAVQRDLRTLNPQSSGVVSGPAAGAVPGLMQAEVPPLPLIQLPKAMGTGGALQAGGEIAPFHGALSTRLSDPRPLPAGFGGSLSEAVLGPMARFSSVPLEQLAQDLPEQAAFLELKDGDTVPRDQINVRVATPPQTQARLWLNGQEISESRIGKKVVAHRTGAQALEYIALKLRPGLNALELQALDDFEIVRGQVRIQVRAPGQPATLRLTPQDRWLADPRQKAWLKLELMDAAGIPVTARTSLTLNLQGATWLTPDLNPDEPGLQVLVEEGQALLEILAPPQPGQAVVSVQSEGLTHSQTFMFAPALTPLQGIGIVEGVLDLRHGGKVPLGGVQAGQAFETELHGLSASAGKAQAGGRAAFYFKGTVKGEYLLTAAFDSDKRRSDRLFRDIRPDEFYPVYGDGSVRGFDAQSAGPLYVRIDKDRSFVLLGDFNTASSPEVRQLSQFSRVLSGIQHRYQDERLRATSFLAQTNATQQVEEIPASGLSFYALGQVLGEVRPGSEKVELIVRDRRQPDIVLSTTPLNRMTDYSFEPMTRRLYLVQPLPSLDANANPQSIRITYELDVGGPSYSVAGTDVQLRVTDTVQLGAVAVRDDNPQHRRELRAATALVALSPSLGLAAEYVQTESEFKGSGSGARMAVHHEGAASRSQVQAVLTDAAFDNLGSTVAGGRSELRAQSEHALSESTRLRAEASLARTSQANAGSATGSVNVALAHRLSEEYAVEAGLRHGNATGSATLGSTGGPTGQAGQTSALSLATGSAAQGQSTAARARLTARPRELPRVQLFGEVEQYLEASRQHALALGGQYLVTDKTRVYAQHALVSGASSVSGQGARQLHHATVAGVESSYLEGGRIYNEYRASQDAPQNASGIRQSFKLNEHWRLNAGAEHIQSLGAGAAGAAGVAAGTSTTVTLGAEWARDDWRVNTGTEQRRSAAVDSSLYHLAAARRLSDDLTLLGRMLSTHVDGAPGGGHNRLDRQQIGLAWRPTQDNRLNTLARYEHRLQDVAAAGSASSFALGVANANVGITEDHILSAHLSWQIDRAQSLSLRHGLKHTQFNDGSGSQASWAQLLHARYTRDLDKDWDVGLQSGYLWGSVASHQFTLGAELGFQLMPGLWLSGGHNILGLSAPDLAGTSHTRRGSYIRLRWKFDEEVFQFGQVARRGPSASVLASVPTSAVVESLVPAQGRLSSAQAAVDSAPQEASAPGAAQVPQVAQVVPAPAPLPAPEPAAAPASAAVASAMVESRYSVFERTVSLDIGDIRERVRSWASAWAAKDLATYFGFYGDGFVPGRQDRQVWEQHRRRMLTKAGDIDLQIGVIELRPQADGSVLSVFSQRYQSLDFRDVSLKVLRWQRVQGRWLIIQESNR